MKVVIEMLTKRVDYARFRQVYFSEAFNQELVTAVNLKERTVREHTQLPDGRERLRTYIAPKVDLPSFIAKLVEGFEIGYEEVTVFDPATRHADVAVHTAGGDRLHVAAQTQFSEEGDGIRTRIDLEVRVKLLGIGSMIERFMVKETVARYQVVERELQRFIDAGADRAADSATV
ncbi:MAG: DUF2505 family protein [Polyangiales bacterium]